MFKKILLGVSVLPAVVIMPVFAGIKVDEPLTYDEPFEAEGINDTVHGGAFWVYDPSRLFRKSITAGARRNFSSSSPAILRNALLYSYMWLEKGSGCGTARGKPIAVRRTASSLNPAIGSTVS